MENLPVLPKIAAALELPDGAPCYRLCRLREADGKPVSLQTLHLPAALCPDVEDNDLSGGWVTDLAAIVADEAFDWLDAPIKRVSAPDTPVPFAPVLKQFYVRSAARIVEMVRSLLQVLRDPMAGEEPAPAAIHRGREGQ